MTDTAVILDGVVVQVWRDTTPDDLPPPDAGELVAFDAPLYPICSQLWDGAALTDPPVATAIPAAVLSYQLRLYLESEGLTADAEAAIDGASAATGIEWLYRPDVPRDGLVMTTLSAGFWVDPRLRSIQSCGRRMRCNDQHAAQPADRDRE